MEIIGKAIAALQVKSGVSQRTGEQSRVCNRNTGAVPEENML